jgi:hypothetical protein
MILESQCAFQHEGFTQDKIMTGPEESLKYVCFGRECTGPTTGFEKHAKTVLIR